MGLYCEYCGKKKQFRKSVNKYVCKNWRCLDYWKYGKTVKFMKAREVNILLEFLKPFTYWKRRYLYLNMREHRLGIDRYKPFLKKPKKVVYRYFT